MKHLTFLACLLVMIAVHAQYTGPGFYRVHNVGSDSYICIKGTRYVRSFQANAFWPCVKMMKDSDQVTEPGSIIYIPDTVETALYSQGVDTYSLTNLYLDVMVGPAVYDGMITYVASVIYENGTFYFMDYGMGMTSSSNTRRSTSHWWIEPVNEASIDTSFLAVKPVVSDTTAATDCYWATMCCDFPLYIPSSSSGVEGAYTIKQVVLGDDSIYYAEPIKVYGQGDTVPAATPIMFKCLFPYASGNKVVPVGKIANHTAMPISNDLLKGNYFSSFVNYCDLSDKTATTVYVPTASTPASPTCLALGVDDKGYPTFRPNPEGTYMEGNTAWLDVTDIINTKNALNVRLGTPPQPLTPKPVAGDVNGDGVVDIDDVAIVINNVIGHGTTHASNCDVNGDGRVDVDDVSAVIHMILHPGN